MSEPNQVDAALAHVVPTVKPSIFTEIDKTVSDLTGTPTHGNAVKETLINARVKEIFDERVQLSAKVITAIRTARGERNRIRPSQVLVSPDNGTRQEYFTPDEVKKRQKLDQWLGDADRALSDALNHSTAEHWKKLEKYTKGPGNDNSGGTGESSTESGK